MGIKLTVVSPQTVDVVFDTVGEKTLPVTTDTSGITIADGFTLNRITTTPTEVTLTGPTSELDKISEVGPLFRMKARFRIPCRQQHRWNCGMKTAIL